MSPGCLRLSVADDGHGFDVANAAALVREGHFGIAGMRERVELVGGTWTIQSSPGGGTTLTAEIPAWSELPARNGNRLSLRARSVESLNPIGLREKGIGAEARSVGVRVSWVTDSRNACVAPAHDIVLTEWAGMDHDVGGDLACGIRGDRR